MIHSRKLSISYDEQFIVAKFYAIKLNAKGFLLNTENYTNFAARNPLMKLVANKSHSSDKLCSEFAPRNHEYSESTDNDNTISEITPNNSHSSNEIETKNFPHSLFALNRPTNQLKQHSTNFKRIADTFQNVLMMSQSDEETLSVIKQATPSKIRFADELGHSTALSTPSHPQPQVQTQQL